LALCIARHGRPTQKALWSVGTVELRAADAGTGQAQAALHVRLPGVRARAI